MSGKNRLYAKRLSHNSYAVPSFQKGQQPTSKQLCCKSGSVCKAWLMAHAEQNSWLSFPSCFTGTINKVTSIPLHSMTTFLPHLLEDHRERIENSEGNEVKTQWKSTDVVQMLQVLVICPSLGKHEGMKWFWWQSCHSSLCWQQPALQLVLLFWGGLKVQYVLWIHT